MTTDTIAVIEKRSICPDGSRYPSTGVSPEEIEALKAEREALVAALQPFAEAWRRRQPRMGDSAEAYERRIERALAGFYSAGGGDERLVLTGQHLKDAHDALGGMAGEKTIAAIDEQWWLAELDQHGNPTLVDGAHNGRDGADQAKYLFDRLDFSGDRRLVVARVTLSEPKPSSEGVNEEALGALNSIGLRPSNDPAEECDHDWEDMGDGTMACTYPDCNATRPKRPEDDEEA